MSVGPIPGPVGAPATPLAAPSSTAVASTATAGAVAVEPAVAAEVVSATETALMSMIGDAAASQDSLAPLLANLGVAATSPQTPDAARATAAQILATQTPLDAEVTPAALKTAVQSSGLFLEAGLAEAVLNPQTAAAPSLAGDLKALLLRLTAQLSAPETAETAPTPTTSAPPGPSTPAPTASMPAAPTSADRPPPPVSGAATAGQAAAPPSLGPLSSHEAIVATLKQQAASALARVQLSQAASLPKPDQPSHWTFELPIATPNGAAVAQFEITRDGQGGGAASGDAEPAWRARFSLDVTPSGPVHVDLSVNATQSRVILMAQNEDARRALAAGQDELVAALTAEQGGDVAVRVTGGAPVRPKPPPGHFLDASS